MATIDQKVECGVTGEPNSRGRFSQTLQLTCCLPATVLANFLNSSLFGLHITIAACCGAGISITTAWPVNTIKKRNFYNITMKAGTTKSVAKKCRRLSTNDKPINRSPIAN